MSQYEQFMRAQDIPPEALAEVLDLLLERLNLRIVREETPDYTAYSLETKPV